jgi:mannose-1-phosphate guanylyltransferase/mannose-6-phosphate isomerase
MMGRIYPVILAGGSGTRLWPLSQPERPKQFLPLLGERTMFQDTVARLAGAEDIAPPVIVSNEAFHAMISEQLAVLGVSALFHVLEPVGRNTAPAIAMAAHLLRAEDETATLLVLPADHHIGDEDAFIEAIMRGAEVAQQAGRLVTFGIAPESPETGYGYIELGEPLGIAGAHDVRQFREKPDLETAQAYLAGGRHFWNSGIFMFTAEQLLREMGHHCADILHSCAEAVAKGARDGGVVRPCRETFAACRADSIDYAVMEPTGAAAVLPVRFGWNDVGSWDALWQIAGKDEAGNAHRGETVIYKSNNCYVHGAGRRVTIIGAEDLIVVDNGEEVLVVRRGQTQNVKEVVDRFINGGGGNK